jgi:LacI family transcriptional regulator
MNLRKRVTIKQVAKESGVSVQTVSRVINNHRDVSPETRKRVEEVASQLMYRPSHIARTLIQGRSCTLGVVGTGLEYYGPSRTLAGIQKQADELGYIPLLALVRQAEQSRVKQLMDELLSRHVDGIIWAVPEIAANREWVKQEINQFPVPVVFLNMEPHPDLSVVAIDNRKGGYIATQHLLAKGYRRIGLITGPLDWWEARQRKLGWQDALREAGLAVQDCLVVEGDWSPASGERGLRRLIEQCPDVQAVFIGNDQMALGALRVAPKLSRRVPQDLTVVGFDDIPESAYFHPSLSTIKQDTDELGSRAVRELIRMVETNQQEAEKVESKTVLLQPQLIVRESSDRSNPDG